MKKLHLFITVFFFLLVLGKANANGFDHTIFDQLLQKHVKNGLVDYKGFKSNKTQLDFYLKNIEQVNANDFESWAKEEKMALWINAYNAITLEGILRNYPIQWGGFLAKRRFPQSSIRQISKFWDTVIIKPMGKNLTLNQIEHEILRKEFNDPRIHFVIVCASIGCPILESQAFFAEDLNQRLDQASENFVTDSAKVRLDKRKDVLYLSSIFDWYKEDFKKSDKADRILNNYRKKDRGVVEFVLNYIGETEKNYILQHQPKIKYLDYDWSLNEQK
jgi:hypothetical protein